MNYPLTIIFAAAGTAVLVWNKDLSRKLGAFYSQRFVTTFGQLAFTLGWDNSSSPFNRFLYRGFVIAAGIILLIFAFAALVGTNFVGPPYQVSNSTLQGH